MFCKNSKKKRKIEEPQIIIGQCDDDDNAEITTDRNHIFFYCDVNTKNCLELNRRILALEEKMTGLKNAYRIKKDPVICIHINSFGGSVFDAMSTIDTIINCSVPVHTYIEGCAASAATLISVVADKRFMGKHAHMLIHQLSSGFWGTMREFKDEMKNNKKLMKMIVDIYLEHTDVDKEKINEILEHDLWWSSKKCLKLKLVDKVL